MSRNESKQALQEKKKLLLKLIKLKLGMLRMQ